MAWNLAVHGDGRPLVLVHGIASSSHVWNPLLPRLAAQRRVVTVDLPGHGGTPSLPDPADRLVPAMAARLVEELARVGVEPPFDVAGNSLGGWTALEVAKLGAARSVVGLSPAGLWPGTTPPGIARHFLFLRRVGSATPDLTRRLLRHPAGRAVAFGTLFGRPWRMPHHEALAAYEGFVASPAFLELREVLAPTRFAGGQTITVPVTVAFGARDMLLRRRTARHAGELPAHTRWVTLPGCGHVPTWDDPALVADVVLQGTA